MTMLYMRPLRFSLFLTTFLAWTCSSSEVPLKKADKPLMNPKVTMPEITHKVYLDIDMGSAESGWIVIGLFGTVAPKAVENFRALCACDRGNAKVSKQPLCYKGSTFHRIIPNFMIQGGDFTNGDGTGGESIYGHRFEDESSFQVPHNKLFLLSMANAGKPNTNGSQFFINTVKTSWLDHKNVVFGMVLGGAGVVQAIERLGTNGGKPTSPVIIKDSGVLPLDYVVENDPYDGRLDTKQKIAASA